MITGKQRAALRRMSNSLDTIYQVGKGGFSPERIKGLSDALEARELVKLRVLENSGMTTRSVADALSDELSCEIVSVVGGCIVIYRRSPIEKNRKIELPK